MIEVQAAVSSPVRFKDHDYIRVGSHKHKLKDYPEKERRLWARFAVESFETGIALTDLDVDDVLGLLDYAAYFDLSKQSLPDDKLGVLARLAEEKLVRRTAGRYDVTNLGAILFARDLEQFGRLARKTCRIIKYRGDGRTQTEREWTDPLSRSGYAAGFKRLFRISLRNFPKASILARISDARANLPGGRGA